jgi:hypothetical protein
MRFTGVIGVMAGVAGLVSALPSSCDPTVMSPFELTTVPLGSVVSLTKRGGCSGDSTLVVHLTDSVLVDAKGRTGYISSNDQLQFDKPAQSGFKTADGFSVCSNGTVLLDESPIFWACKSGPFSNIYSVKVAPQCEPVQLNALFCGDDAADIPAPVGAPVVTTVVPAILDGVETAITTALPVPLCQINDGQVQAHPTPCNVIDIGTITISATVTGTPGKTTLQSILTTVGYTYNPTPTPTETTLQPNSGVREHAQLAVICVVGVLSTVAMAMF